MHIRDINTENTVIWESNLEGDKPFFSISVNITNTFQTHMKQEKQSFCVTISRREKDGV